MLNYANMLGMFHLAVDHQTRIKRSSWVFISLPGKLPFLFLVGRNTRLDYSLLIGPV